MAEESRETGEQDKTEEPTQHRIDEFRKRGQVAASKELSSVLILAASFATLGLSMIFIYEELGRLMEWLSALNLEQAYAKEHFKVMIYRVLETMLLCAAPIFLVSFLIGVFSQIIQVGLIYAPNVLEIKFDKINPINGLKRIFSIRSLAEAIKGFGKFIIIIGVAYLVFSYEVWSFGGFLQSSIIQSFLYGKYLMLKMGFMIIAGLAVLAAFDFAWEKFQYHKRLRQTRQQLKEETKEKEGNPEIKQRIRSIQRKVAQKRMMQEVPKADVIVSNPTHISVAVKYDQDTMISPRVVAKGADQIAFKIREIAQKYQVPVVENVPLARTLYKTVRIGESIPRTLYKAVAEILAFVYKMKKRRR